MSNKNTARMGFKVDRIFTALFLLAATGFLYSFLFVHSFLPTEGNIWDSLLYLAPGQRMYQGEMIYRDVFEFVTPGTALVNFLMFRVFGLRLWIPNLLALLLGLGLVWLGVVISRKLMRPSLALLPSAVFLVSARGFLCDATHHWYSVLAALAAIAVLLEKRTPARIVGAGLLCGLSASFTQTRGLAVVIGFAMYLWWESRQRHERWRVVLKKEVSLLASCLLAFLAINGYFISEAGPRRYFWCTVVYVLKYYPKLASANTFQVIKADFPVYTSFGTFLHPLAQWLFLSAIIPIIYVLFFVHYWRKSRKLGLEYWERPMLVAVVGLFMLLSIAPAPDYLRMMASMLPPLILLVWLFDSSARLARACLVTLTVVTLLVAFYSLAESRPRPVGVLKTPEGELAFTEPKAYQETLWIQQHTQPSDYFYKAAYPDVYFYLDLRNPTPLSCIENDGYTTPEQVAKVIHGLEEHHVRYILWNPLLLDTLQSWENPADAHLGPLRDYLHSHYKPVMTFANADEIFEKTTE
jgi:hypothetical protein